MGEYEELVEALHQDLKNLISKGNSPADANAALIRDQERLFGKYPGALDDRLRALERAYALVLEDLNRVKYLQRRALRFGREEWYLGPSPDGSLWGLLHPLLEDHAVPASQRRDPHGKWPGHDDTTAMTVMHAISASLH